MQTRYAPAEMIGFINNGRDGRKAIVECGGMEFTLHDLPEGQDNGVFGNPDPHVGEFGNVRGIAYVKVQVRGGKAYALTGPIENQSFDTPIPIDVDKTVTLDQAKIAIIMNAPKAVTYWSGIDAMGILGKQEPETVEEADALSQAIEEQASGMLNVIIERGNDYLEDTIEYPGDDNGMSM